MFGYGHELHGGISGLLYSRQDQIRKFVVCAYSSPLLRHAYVGLVYEQVSGRCGREIVVMPYVWFGGPELRRVVLALLVLHHARGVGGYAVQPAVCAVYVHLVE